MEASGILAAAATQLTVVLILLCVIVIPVAAIAFARSGRAYDEIGKGQFAVDFDDGREDSSDQDEIRQLVEAKAFRQQQRGEDPVNVESEVERLLGGGTTAPVQEPGDPATTTATEDSPPDPADASIRDEIRQVVIANNERRLRRGEPPLDEESEVQRMLDEFS